MFRALRLLPAGVHVLSATAIDHLGRSTVQTMSVTVVPPTTGFEAIPSGALDAVMLGVSEYQPNKSE